VVHYGVNGRTSEGTARGPQDLPFYRVDSEGRIAEEHRYMDSLTPTA
jgi:hypothetical protein